MLGIERDPARSSSPIPLTGPNTQLSGTPGTPLVTDFHVDVEPLTTPVWV